MLPSKRSQYIISAYVIINYLSSVHTRKDVLWPGNIRKGDVKKCPSAKGVEWRDSFSFLIVSRHILIYPKRQAHYGVSVIVEGQKAIPRAILVFLMEQLDAADERSY